MKFNAYLFFHPSHDFCLNTAEPINNDTMFSGIFFAICGLLIVAAVFYMLLHKRRTRLEDKHDNPVSAHQFDKERGGRI